MRIVTTTQDHQQDEDPITGRTAAIATERDSGYTVLELILVVLVIGMMTSVVIFAVTGMRADAAGSGCAADRRSLATAAEAYFAEHGSDPIPATGSDHDRYERTLVDAGLLWAVSTSHDLDATGAIDHEGTPPC